MSLPILRFAESQFYEVPYTLNHYFLNLKVALAASTALFATIVDGVGEVKGWEDVGMKALLICAVVYLVRSQAQDRKEHKDEMAASWELQKKECSDRELKTTAAMEANTHALNSLTEITKEQTDYFKTVTRTIVDERLNTKPHLP